MRIKTSSNRPTLTPENNAVIHKLSGTKYRNTRIPIGKRLSRLIKIGELMMGRRYDNF